MGFKKKFYDEIYEDIIRSIQEFEDDFSNERCFDKSPLDCVVKRLLPKDCHALFSVLTKGDDNCLYNCPYNSISLLLTREQSQLLTDLRIKVVGEMVKNMMLVIF